MTHNKMNNKRQNIHNKKMYASQRKIDDNVWVGTRDTQTAAKIFVSVKRGSIKTLNKQTVKQHFRMRKSNKENSTWIEILIRKSVMKGKNAQSLWEINP